MSRRGTLIASEIGILVMAGLLIGVNIISGFAYLRGDLTEDKLYTLSPGSKQILADLENQVTIHFYYSRGVRELPGYLKNYASRVEDLLKEYEVAANGKVKVKKYNPTPDSDAEDSARLDGIQGRQLGNGEMIYLGLSVLRADLTETLPFLSPDTENTLEYDVSRAVYQVAYPEKRKRKVGIMSSLPVMGAPPMPQQFGRQQPNMAKPWAFVELLKSDYQVETVNVDTDSISPDIGVLIVIHPKSPSEKTLYAIDQYLMRGGKLIAFVDPVSAFDRKQGPMAQFQPPSPSTLGVLLDAWGVSFDTSKVVADMRHGFPDRGFRQVSVLGLDSKVLNHDDLLTRSLNLLVVLYAGALEVDPAEGLESTVLMRSSNEAQLVESFMVANAPKSAYDNFKSDDKEYALAVKLTGKFKTAFDEGKPIDDDRDEEDEENKEEGDEEHLAESVGDTAVVVIADADLLHQSIWLEERRDFFSGRTIPVPRYDNNNLLQNAVEYLSGDNMLISIRAKTITARPFQVVKNMELEAQRLYKDKLKKLQDEHQKVQQRINELQRAKKDDKQQYILSPAQIKELNKTTAKEIEFKKEIKLLRKQIRRKIDSLENTLKICNILLMPLLIAGLGLGVWIFRTRAAR